MDGPAHFILFFFLITFVSAAKDVDGLTTINEGKIATGDLSTGTICSKFSNYDFFPSKFFPQIYF